MMIKKIRKILKITVIMIILFVILSAQDNIKTDSLYFGNITVNSSENNHNEIINKLSSDYFYKFFHKNNYREFSNQLMDLPISQGFYYPSVTLKQINLSKSGDSLFVNPEFKMDWGEEVFIDTFFFAGLINTSPKLLSRQLKKEIHSKYDNQLHLRIKEGFRRYSFLKITENREIVKSENGKYGLVLDIEEVPDNEFSGIAGYVPEKSGEDGYFTGEIDLKLMNLGGMGRQVSVYWSKINSNSQKIELKYFEPWIWKTNYFGGADFKQDLRDTLVVIREFGINFGKNVSQIGNILLDFSVEKTIPTPGGRDILGLSATNSKLLGAEFNRDKRDNLNNPIKGYKILLNLSAGSGNNEKIDSWQAQTKFGYEFFIPIRKNKCISFIGNYAGKWLSGREVLFSEQFRLGGANNLRGYPEDFFKGAEVMCASVEFRWIIGESSRLYGFFDQGYYKYKQNNINIMNYPNSIGLGMRLESRMGIIGIDYGFGEGDSFSTAKIHLHLENKF